MGTNDNPILEKRKAEVQKCTKLHVEHILRTINEFKDICKASCLNLTTGPKKFTKFCEFLGEIIWDDWDRIIDGMYQTNNNFNQATKQFIAKYIKTTDLTNQQRYIDNYQCPHSVKVCDLGNCFPIIAVYLKRFPGSNNTDPYAKANKKKNTFC